MKKLIFLGLISCFSIFLFAQAEKEMREANVLFQKGKYTEAIELYAKVIEADPEDLNAHIQRGLALSIVNKYEEAIEDYNYVIAQKPDLTAVKNSRGSAYMKLKKYDKAEQDFNSVLTIDPKNVEAYNNRGWCKKYQGDVKGACEDWKKSKKLGSGDAKIFMNKNGC